MELLSEDDLRLQIWNSRGIELPQDWDRDQILDWYEKDIQSEPPIRGRPDEGGRPQKAASSEEFRTTETSFQKVLTYEDFQPIDIGTIDIPNVGPLEVGPVGQPLASLSPRSRARQILAYPSQLVTTQIPLEEVKIPEVGPRIQQVTTPQSPQIVPKDLYTELELKLKNVSELKVLLKNNNLTIPRLKQQMIDVLLEEGLDKQGRTAATRLEAVGLESKGLEIGETREVGLGGIATKIGNVEETKQITVQTEIPVLPLKGGASINYETGSLPLQTNFSTLEALRNRLPTSMFVNKNAAFQDKVPANPQTEILLTEPAIQPPAIPSQVIQPPVIQPAIPSQVIQPPVIQPPAIIEPAIQPQSPIQPAQALIQEIPIVSAEEIEIPSSNLYEKIDLQLKNVQELNDLLRQNGLRVPRLKAEKIELLLQEGIDKAGKIRSKRLESQTEAAEAVEIPKEPTVPVIAEPVIAEPIAPVIPEPVVQEIPEPIAPVIPIPEPQMPETELFTELELKLKNVNDLKDYLRKNNLNIPRLKANMVSLLLEEGLDKEGNTRKTKEIPRKQEIQPQIPAEIQPIPIQPVQPEVAIPPQIQPQPVAIPAQVPPEVIIPQPVTTPPQIQPQVQLQVQTQSDLYTETDLKLKTVVELRDLLRQNGLKIPKLKVQMIKLLLDEGIDKQGNIRSKKTPSQVTKALEVTEPDLVQIAARKSEKEEEIEPVEPVFRPPSGRPPSGRRRVRGELPEIQPVEEPLPPSQPQPQQPEIKPIKPEIRPIQIRITPKKPRIPEFRQPISTVYATPELEARLTSSQPSLTTGGPSSAAIPILVTPENVSRVRLPVYATRSTTRLTPIPRTPLTQKGEEKELIQPYTPQQKKLEILKTLQVPAGSGKPFTLKKVSSESARSGSDIYKSSELQEVAKVIGIKITGKKANLVENIKAELERIGYVEPK